MREGPGRGSVRKCSERCVYYHDYCVQWGPSGLRNPLEARVAKSADAKDLKSFFAQAECGFKSRPGHQIRASVPRRFEETITAGYLAAVSIQQFASRHCLV